MIKNKALEKKYGTVSDSSGRISGSKKSLYHRAIREELFGGNILLDLNEMLFLLGGQRNRSKECREFAGFCSTAVANIKQEMVNEITRRYTEPVGRESARNFLKELDDITKSDRLNGDTLEALNYVRNQIVTILAEMVGEAEGNNVDEPDGEE